MFVVFIKNLFSGNASDYKHVSCNDLEDKHYTVDAGIRYCRNVCQPRLKAWIVILKSLIFKFMYSSCI